MKYTTSLLAAGFAMSTVTSAAPIPIDGRSHKTFAVRDTQQEADTQPSQLSPESLEQELVSTTSEQRSDAADDRGTLLKRGVNGWSGLAGDLANFTDRISNNFGGFAGNNLGKAGFRDGVATPSLSVTVPRGPFNPNLVMNNWKGNVDMVNAYRALNPRVTKTRAVTPPPPQPPPPPPPPVQEPVQVFDSRPLFNFQPGGSKDPLRGLADYQKEQKKPKSKIKKYALWALGLGFLGTWAYTVGSNTAMEKGKEKGKEEAAEEYEAAEAKKKKASGDSESDSSSSSSSSAARKRSADDDLLLSPREIATDAIAALAAKREVPLHYLS